VAVNTRSSTWILKSDESHKFFFALKIIFCSDLLQNWHLGHHGHPVVKLVVLVKRPGSGNVNILTTGIHLLIIHVEMLLYLKEKYVIPKSAQFTQSGRIGANAPCLVVEENNLKKGLVFCHQYQVCMEGLFCFLNFSDLLWEKMF
jgi:hypothetical protein